MTENTAPFAMPKDSWMFDWYDIPRLKKIMKRRCVYLVAAAQAARPLGSGRSVRGGVNGLRENPPLRGVVGCV